MCTPSALPSPRRQHAAQQRERDGLDGRGRAQLQRPPQRRAHAPAGHGPPRRLGRRGGADPHAEGPVLGDERPHVQRAEAAARDRRPARRARAAAARRPASRPTRPRRRRTRPARSPDAVAVSSRPSPRRRAASASLSPSTRASVSSPTWMRSTAATLVRLCFHHRPMRLRVRKAAFRVVRARCCAGRAAAGATAAAGAGSRSCSSARGAWAGRSAPS